MTITQLRSISSLAPNTIPLWINGQQHVSTKTFPVRNVITEKPMYECSNASMTDADEALASATAALPQWAISKASARRDILLASAALIDKRRNELEDTIRQEIGASPDFARFNTRSAAEMLRDAAGRIPQCVMGQVLEPQQEGQNAMLYKVPYGVVLGIAPWNAPYILGFRAAIYPIAAGNTCILKGAESSPGCFHHIARIFHDAGLPQGVLNVLYTTRQDSPAVTNYLIRDPAIQKVNFTGSTAVGAAIAVEASKVLKSTLMELGGKASAIVTDDADIQLAATQCVRGAFLNSGQACMSTERILVSRKIVEPFKRAFLEEVKQWDSGVGRSCILIQESAVEKNLQLIQDAQLKGAQVIAGGSNGGDELLASGKESSLRIKPTVVEGVDKNMQIYYEESFGPTVSLYVVDSDEEALKIANDTEYGLSCSIFTTDLARGLKLARQVSTGAVHINSMSVHDEPALPHGGQKSSGWGRFNSEWGINEFLQARVVTYMD